MSCVRSTPRAIRQFLPLVREARRWSVADAARGPHRRTHPIVSDPVAGDVRVPPSAGPGDAVNVRSWAVGLVVRRAGVRTRVRAVFGIVFLAGGVLGIVAGWGLLDRQPWSRGLALVLGFVNLIHIPFGTAVGIYTLWVLLPAQSEREFRARAA